MNSIGTYTLFKKEIRRFREVWTQTVAAPVVSNILFLTVFGVALSGRASGFEGFDYLQVLVPGLAAMGVALNSFGNPVGSLMIAKYTNVITELLMIPLKGFEVALAYIAAGVVRGLTVGVVTVLVGMFFTDVNFASIPLILIFAAFIGGTFASFGSIVGILAKDFDQSQVIQNFILTPMIYLGGVFYSISNLPDFVQTLSRFNPVFYMIDGFRRGFLGVGDSSLAVALLVTGTLFACAFAGASYMFHTGYKLKQ